MAHPARGEHARRLSADLGVPVTWDEEGPPSGAGDRVWRTARRTWLAHDPDADWHVLIQDDAYPCPDFLAGLAAALERVPTPAIVSPYLGKGRNVPNRWAAMADRADAQLASWVRSTKVMWGVCLAAPVSLIPDMVTWCDRKAGMPDDMRLSSWAQRHHVEVWYTWPSLVDHGTEASLTKHRAADRVARRHHQGSALELSWGGPVVDDPMTIRRRGPRSGPRGAWQGSMAPVA